MPAIGRDIESTKSENPKPHGRRYPWAEWFAKGKFRLFQGKDFVGRTYAMAQQVRNAASRERHNLSVRIRVAASGKFLSVEVVGEKE